VIGGEGKLDVTIYIYLEGGKKEKAAFPLTSKTPNHWKRCLISSFTSFLVLLA
jgi:hypothetical protein